MHAAVFPPPFASASEAEPSEDASAGTDASDGSAEVLSVLEQAKRRGRM